jgi:hypothetical protein
MCHTNLLERAFGETRRRTKVIGRFPGERSCLTLVGQSWTGRARAGAGLTYTPAAPGRSKTSATSYSAHPSGRRSATRSRLPPSMATHSHARRFLSPAGRDLRMDETRHRENGHCHWMSHWSMSTSMTSSSPLLASPLRQDTSRRILRWRFCQVGRATLKPR